jgi:hypothetical protein
MELQSAGHAGAGSVLGASARAGAAADRRGLVERCVREARGALLELGAHHAGLRCIGAELAELVRDLLVG